MKRLDAGTSGTQLEAGGLELGCLPDEQWVAVLEALARGRSLRPVQYAAVAEHRILESRSHLVVCSPTNSGKSLIGHLILLDAVRLGRRAVLLEPLRALAQEQAETLTELLSQLPPDVMPQRPKVRISTGDYRLEGEMPASAPPGEGEIIVATPERLDAILRNPRHVPWANTIGALVVDEAHLVGDARRGPTLELVIASMLSMPAPPRIALLSATIGEPERLQSWLSPCQLIISTSRTPLVKQVWQLETGDDADEILASELSAVLADPANAAIVFVYQRRSAESLARKLNKTLGDVVRTYHSGRSASERAGVRAEFESGACRCVVSTTALAMGVNLPATHVFVRDTSFFGFGKLRADELLQIVGRAGRGDRTGTGVVLVRPSDDWDADELAKALRCEVLPALRSSFEAVAFSGSGKKGQENGERDLAAASLVATCVGRTAPDGIEKGTLEAVLGNTLGGSVLVSKVDGALRWLTEPSRALAYRDEAGRNHLTVLGLAGVRSMLPLNYVAGLGQLVRDLLSLDPNAALLGRWRPVDHLLIASLLSDRAPKLRRFSEELAEQIDSWIESRPHDGKSLLFAEWVTGTSTCSKADELFGSLGLATSGPRSGGLTQARRRAYVAMLGAIVLDERSRGVSVEDIERRWGIQALGGVEEAYRDTVLWLLAGHAAVFELRSFFHHLKENCSAEPDQIRKSKRVLGKLRRQTFDLLERLNYCSPLGSMLRGVRELRRTREEPTLGIRTIRCLEESGVTSMEMLAQMDVAQLVASGVQQRYAEQIRGYLKRRMW